MTLNSIKRDELVSLSHSELNDSVLIDIAARELNTSAYQLIRSAMLICNGHLYETHVDAAFNTLMMGPGRIDPEYRKYIVDVLLGNNIFINDADGDQNHTILLA